MLLFQLFGGASEEYFLLQIVQRNSSALNITNMETGIHRLQYNPEFNGLRLNGTVTINFIGFVLPGNKRLYIRISFPFFKLLDKKIIR